MKLEEMVGKMMTEAQFDEAAGKKDACYHKVKARYDVWPSAYASGALVKCRKAGAANWGNSKKEGVNEVDTPMFKITYKDSAGRKKTDIMRAKNSKLAKRDFDASNQGRGFKILKVVKEGLNEKVSQVFMMTKAFDAILKKQTRGKKPTLKDLERVYTIMRGRYKDSQFDNPHMAESVIEGLGDIMSKKLKKLKGVNLKKKKSKLKIKL